MKIAVVDRFYGSPYGFSKPLVEALAHDHFVQCFTGVKPDLTDFDLVHFDWADYVTVNGVALLAKGSKRPRVTVRLHAYELHEDWMTQMNWSAVDQLIFVSQHYRELFDRLGLKTRPKYIVTVNHGIDLDRFSLQPDRLGNNILSVGSINFKKGPQLLAQVAMALSNEVHVYGDVQCVRSQIYFDHLAIPNLKFFPRNDRIQEVMRDPQYRYILSTSLGESFHLSIAEGMASGLQPLVHSWYGADQLWPLNSIWRTIDSLKKLINLQYQPDQYREKICRWYDARKQLPKLVKAIVGEPMNLDPQLSHNVTPISSEKPDTLAICMVTKDNFKGVERAIRSCSQYLDDLYLAVDDRDIDNTADKTTKLAKELGILHCDIKTFKAPDPWDFSYARNIAHEMNQCTWALVLDDDEYVLHPEEIPELLKNCHDKDVVDVTCGMGADEYGNVEHTWKFSRFMKQKVRWINPRHNLPDPKTFSTSTFWIGDLVVVDDKSIRPIQIRAARNEQRETNVDVFRKKIDANPNDTRSLFYLATAFRESGKYWEALHWYEQYLKTGGWDEERWQACYDMAKCQLALKRYTEARKSLHRAIEEKPNRAEAYVFMGDIFYDIEHFEDALTWFRLGCALPEPQDARLFVQRSIYDWERYDKISMAFSHLEDYQSAIEYVEKALAKRPRDERLLNNVRVWKEKI